LNIEGGPRQTGQIFQISKADQYRGKRFKEENKGPRLFL